MEFSKQLLTHAQVAVAPGVGFGEEGEGFVRIALVENEHRIRQAARNVRRYLQSDGGQHAGADRAITAPCEAVARLTAAFSPAPSPVPLA